MKLFNLLWPEDEPVEFVMEIDQQFVPEDADLSVDILEESPELQITVLRSTPEEGKVGWAVLTLEQPIYNPLTGEKFEYLPQKEE